jgi:hypothetical protein
MGERNIITLSQFTRAGVPCMAMFLAERDLPLSLIAEANGCGA